MAPKRHKKIITYTLVALGLLVVVGSSVSYYLSRHYRRIIKTHLPEWAAAAADSVYKVEIGDISINLLNRKVKVVNVHIFPDTAHLSLLRRQGRNPSLLFDVKVPVVEVKGVLWEDLVLNRELSCNLFSVVGPNIRVLREQSTAPDTLKPLLPDTARKQPPKKEGMALGRLAARRIQVLNAEVSYLHNGDHDTFYCNTRRSSLVFEDWELQPGMKANPAHFLFAKSARLSLASFLFYKPGDLYAMRSDSLVFTSTDSICRFRNLEIKPIAGRKQFVQKTGYQKDIYDVVFGTLTLEQLHWQELLQGKALTAGTLRIEKPDVNIYMDRTAPPNTQSKLGKYPHQLLLKLPLPISIDSAVVKEGKFRYTELAEKTRREGQVGFDAIRGTVFNLTNRPELIARQPIATARLKALFMQSSPLDVTFRFRLTDRSGAFSVDAVLGQLQAYQIREAAQALAVADVSSLQVQKLVFHLNGNEVSAAGDFDFRYRNLKIRLQKVDEETRRLKNRPLLSFLANAVLLYPDNPMEGEPVRTVSVVQQRDPYKSFFNLIWKSIFQALGKTALRGDEALKLVEEQKQKEEDKAQRKAERKERRKERRERREKRKAAKLAAKNNS